MTPDEEGGATVLPPPGALPDGTEPRDTLTPDQEAIARHCAELVVAALAPRLDAFSGLPQTVTDLTNEVVRLRSVVEELAPQVSRHADRLGSVERALRDVEPKLDRLTIIAGETVPELIRRVEAISTQVTNDAARRAQLEKSVEQLEEEFHERERATGNGV